MYSVEEAFEILKSNKITTHKESVRRWLRQGVIKGIAPSTRKEGWKISEGELQKFIQQRLPDPLTTSVVKESDTTNVVKGVNTTSVANSNIKKKIRAEMWIELIQKNIWEGYIEVKKSLIRECIQHKRYSKELEEKVWKACQTNSQAYSKPRISYLLEAFSFDGKRLLLDTNFGTLEEQIMFPVIEHVRKKH